MIYAVFMYPENGYTHHQEVCRNIGLVIGHPYEMKRIDVGDSSSTVYLSDFPKQALNSVHFEFCEFVEGEKVPVDVYSRFYNPHG